jgi:hypothetical protein
LYPPTALRRCGCRAGELLLPFSEVKGVAGGGDRAVQREVAHDAGGREVALGQGGIAKQRGLELGRASGRAIE